jgi:ABC-type multidrug transport system fused ATPase/permease subunit
MIATVKKFYSILEPRQKKSFFYLIILSSLAAFLEMLSVGLLVPIITSLNDPNLPSVLLINKYLDKIFINFTQFNDNKLFFFLLLFGSFFLIKTLILTYFAKVVSKFSSNLYSSISGRIFNNYLHLYQFLWI